ncbi:MAG: FAD-dependent oxidoreductase [Leptospiraceae bacterium]|nr:FAD-dependent oxidoreductase [Leptospiraceae bacterium]
MPPKTVIVGNGISGITLARELRKITENQIIVISSETEHFFSRPALMYIYMGDMKYEHTKPYEDWFWEKNRIELIKAHVKEIHPSANKLIFEDQSELEYDELVLATGSKSNKFGWPGQDLPGVQGFYSYPDLQQLEKNTQGIERAVIVGGGLIGVEVAEMLLSRKINVTFLVRESGFWNIVLPGQEAAMIEREIREHHVDLRMQSNLKEIIAGPDGRVAAVTVAETGERIDCQLVALTVGVSPNIDFVKGSGIETERGILVDRYLRTNLPNVFAIGDCAQFKNPLPDRRPIEQVWYTGKLQAEALAQNLAKTSGNSKELQEYEPGTWYNSAKFFTIEYQVYGNIPAVNPDSVDSFYWEHSSSKICLRINYERETGFVLGIHGLGLRLRQDVCIGFIEKKMTLKDTVKNLKKAFFDPEFYRNYHKEIEAVFKAG